MRVVDQRDKIKIWVGLNSLIGICSVRSWDLKDCPDHLHMVLIFWTLYWVNKGQMLGFPWYTVEEGRKKSGSIRIRNVGMDL